MKPGEGLLLVTHTIVPEARAECDEWYMRQHLPERVAVPGFLRGRRYRACSGELRYLAWYETTAPGVLASPAYVERLENPTAWTQRVMPNFRDMNRSVLRVAATHGDLDGGLLALVLLGTGDAARAAQADLAACARMTDICAVHLLVADTSAPVATVESRLRGRPDDSIEAAIAIEATDEAALRQAAATLVTAAGVTTASTSGPYRLMFGQSAGSR